MRPTTKPCQEWGDDTVKAFEIASENLDRAFELIRSAKLIAEDTRLFLQNQALIYAGYLSDVLAGRLASDPERHESMAEMINEFCALVTRELQGAASSGAASHE